MLSIEGFLQVKIPPRVFTAKHCELQTAASDDGGEKEVEQNEKNLQKQNWIRLNGWEEGLTIQSANSGGSAETDVCFTRENRVARQRLSVI